MRTPDTSAIQFAMLAQTRFCCTFLVRLDQVSLFSFKHLRNALERSELHAARYHILFADEISQTTADLFKEVNLLLRDFLIVMGDFYQVLIDFPFDSFKH